MRDQAGMRYGCVIFDLDGTLLNTLGDLAEATNQGLRALGLPTHAVSDYRYMVGNGIMKLFERALPEDGRSPQNVSRLRECFLAYYPEHNRDLTRPYDGVTDLLRALRREGVTLAVASNKYEQGVRQLVDYYFPDMTFGAVCGQRDGYPTKPDPAIVERILAECRAPARDGVLMVGDSNVDMQTAHRAGVDACGVTWGFRPRAELEAEAPRYLVDAPHELLSIVLG